MTPRQTLLLDAAASALCALAVLVFGAQLAPLFGLDSARALDVTALATLGYAALAVRASRATVVRGRTLMTFAIANAVWVVASAVLLAVCWATFAPLARTLVFVVALVVEVFATLQYRAAASVRGSRDTGLAVV